MLTKLSYRVDSMMPFVKNTKKQKQKKTHLHIF